MRVFKLISLAPHVRGDGYTDGDGKFIYETDSLARACAVWMYWKVLARWSGGWTYVRNNVKYPQGLPNSSHNFYL